MFNKQRKNIKVQSDGSLVLKTGRVVNPKNEVTMIENKVVHFKTNSGICRVDVDDYLKLSLWAHRVTFDHAERWQGVQAFDNGWEHKSLPAAILQTKRGQRVHYHDQDRNNCTKKNLFVGKLKESA